MSINIGDNFSYLGKKFLDNREHFETVAKMKACNDVPNGFITYCDETNTRYEYHSDNQEDVTLGKWRVFKSVPDVNFDEYVTQDELEEALNGTILRFDKDFRIHPKKVSNTEVKQKKEGTVGKTFLKVVKAISSFFLKILNALKELLLQVILQLENDDQELQNVANGSEKEKSKPHSVVAPEPTEKKS